MVTLLATVTEACAMIVPTKVDPVPRVADEMTRQKTLHGLAPLM